MSQIPETRPSLLLRLRDPQDSDAWREFLDIYEPLIQRLARRKGFQDADARELAQDVFVAVSGAIDRWNPDRSRGTFRGWLFRIARNLMINLLRRQGRHPTATGDSDFLKLLHEQPDPNAEETAFFDLEYRRELFRWAAERTRQEVNEATWKAFRETCVEGRSADHVAEELGMSRGAVYVAKSRVMARLRKQIQTVESEGEA
ncbi:MAG: sigma-70 family RNA polymerase sigma factor [Planctomycetes bacterium]|nr:sigma-70 family RNA polymerase sigma factor [Planctomycetota bacterium]